MSVLENVKHEAFAHEIAKGTPPQQAYVQAGYSAKNSGTAAACASRLLNDAKISARVAEIKEAILARKIEKTGITKAWVVAKLVENVERAMQNVPVLDNDGHPTGEYTYEGNVANRALELLGKTEGIFIDRKEIGKPGDFDDKSDEELVNYIEACAIEVQEIEQQLLPAPTPKDRSKQATKH